MSKKQKKQQNQINLTNLDRHGLDEPHARMFYEMVRDFENRKAEEARKNADRILKAYPTHGETMAMKSLMLLNENKMEEAEALVKESIRHAMKSHICWHAYGLLHKQNADYKKALTCFATATRFDAKNLQILRDIANVQAQTRDFKGLIASATKLIQLRPDLRTFWAMLATATHLNGQHKAAISTLDTMIKTGVLKDCTKAELSEVQLFRNLCLRESGDYAAALQHLDKIKTIVTDRIAWYETKANCLLRTGKTSQAADYYMELLKLNPENYEYLSQLQVCKNLPADVTSATNSEEAINLLQHYDTLQKKLPQSNAIQRITLNFASGDNFKKILDEYVRRYIKKSIPSLFFSLKSLYADVEKVAIIEEHFLSMENSLRNDRVFPGTEELQPPTAYLWVTQFLAFHFDRIHQTEKSLAFINKAIDHSPTVVELYLCKARILKHAGDLDGAAECMDLARKMDLADRYLNTKTTKYLLRADKAEQALDTINIFAKQGHGEVKKSNLHEMQAMWYEIEAGSSFLRQKDYSNALKQLTYVIKHFEEIEKDQYDFHGYCMRKLTMCAYVDMLRFEDNLRSHMYFFDASTTLIRAYLELHDNPEAAKEAISIAEKRTKAFMEEEEEKKRKLEEESKKKKKKKTNSDDDDDDNENKIDENPFCLKELQASTYLDEATSLLVALEKFSADKMETYELGIEVYLRKKKYVQVLKAIKEGRKIDPHHPSMHSGIIRLFHEAYNQEGGPDEVVKQILSREKDGLLGDFASDTEGLSSYNCAFLEREAHSLSSCLAVAESMIVLDPSSSTAAAELLTKNVNQANATLQDHIKVLESLRTKFQAPEITEQFKNASHEIFPHCNAFQ